ncbi:MAG: acylphosphatase, partial [Candidatus Bathyarchaeia archaeon]
MRVKIRIIGIIQGVGFRPFVYRIAVKNGLKGYVRNMGDASVEILLEGLEKAISSFLKDLEEKKPPLAQLHKVIVTELDGEYEHSDFRIIESYSGAELSGSVIPPDVAICNECLKELRD